jgi:transcription initiation factor IIE alpha subunit
VAPELRRNDDSDREIQELRDEIRELKKQLEEQKDRNDEDR